MATLKERIALAMASASNITAKVSSGDASVTDVDDMMKHDEMIATATAKAVPDIYIAPITSVDIDTTIGGRDTPPLNGALDEVGDGDVTAADSTPDFTPLVRDSFYHSFTCICVYSWVSVMIYGSTCTCEVLGFVIMFRFSTESDDNECC